MSRGKVMVEELETEWPMSREKPDSPEMQAKIQRARVGAALGNEAAPGRPLRTCSESRVSNTEGHSNLTTSRDLRVSG